MKKTQPKLLDQEKSAAHSGPIFEFTPGWGYKTKKWIKKYVLANDCMLCRSTRYILLTGIIILILAKPKLNSLFKNDVKTNDIISGAITRVVQPGDSKTKLARRAISDYLNRFPEVSFTKGQRLFAEVKLQEKITQDIIISNPIKFSEQDIKTILDASRNLPETQIKKWNEYAARISF